MGYNADYLQCYESPMSNKIALVKGVIYALIMGTVAIVGIVEQGNATYIVLAFLLGALLIFGVEIQTVQIGQWFTIDFEDSHPDENNDE